MEMTTGDLPEIKSVVNTFIIKPLLNTELIASVSSLIKLKHIKAYFHRFNHNGRQPI